MQTVLKSTQEILALEVAKMKAYASAVDAARHRRDRLNPRHENYMTEWTAETATIQRMESLRDSAVESIRQMEAKDMGRSTVKVISRGKKTAQVIIQTRVDGECVSQTRHLRLENGHYVGHSLFGLWLTRYEIGSAENKAAA